MVGWIERARTWLGTWLTTLLARVRPLWTRWDPRVRGGALAAIAVVVITATAILVGLNLGENQPAARADPADAHATAPACDSVSSGVVDSVAPGATLESDRHGPLTNGDSTTCRWTSVDSPDSAPRSLNVDYVAHFTDKSGEVSGTEAATEQMTQLAPAGDLAGSESVPDLGDDALVWPGSADGGSAEVAFRRDNLVVRVYYGGDASAGGQPLSYSAAREGAVSVATGIADSL